MSDLAAFVASAVLLVVVVRWVRQWRAEPAVVGATIPAKARAAASKLLLGRSDRDTIALATAAGIVLMSWLSGLLVELTAQLGALTGLDAAAWAPAGADALGLALVALAVADVAGIGLSGLVPAWLAALFRRIGVGVLDPALRHSIIGLALPAVLLAWTPLLAQTGSDAIAAVRDTPEPAACAPAQLEGGEVAGFGPSRLANAAIIHRVGEEMGVPERGQWIALATAMQESGLRNLDYGDRDSLGLFQQRPSQGWGSPAQIRDPAYAARKFYEALLRVKGWAELPMWQAAQAVQRSAFATAYDKWKARAATVLGAVRGATCTETRS